METLDHMILFKISQSFLLIPLYKIVVGDMLISDNYIDMAVYFSLHSHIYILFGE